MRYLLLIRRLQGHHRGLPGLCVPLGRFPALALGHGVEERHGSEEYALVAGVLKWIFHPSPTTRQQQRRHLPAASLPAGGVLIQSQVCHLLVFVRLPHLHESPACVIRRAAVVDWRGAEASRGALRGRQPTTQNGRVEPSDCLRPDSAQRRPSALSLLYMARNMSPL